MYLSSVSSLVKADSSPASWEVVKVSSIHVHGGLRIVPGAEDALCKRKILLLPTTLLFSFPGGQVVRILHNSSKSSVPGGGHLADGHNVGR